ncbi:MAG: hypothetical protein R3D67_20455 [Hyphomicrobiaceae bacterium]
MSWLPGKDKLVVSGDVTNIASLFMANPGWHVAFDQDAAMAEKSRRAFFEQAVTEGSIITGYHWGIPGAGTIQKDGKGYMLVPVRGRPDYATCKNGGRQTVPARRHRRRGRCARVRRPFAALGCHGQAAGGGPRQDAPCPRDRRGRSAALLSHHPGHA